MNMKSVCLTVIAGAAAALLSACASTGAENVSGKQVAGAGQVCTTEAQLGSSIAHRSCRAPMTQEERDAVARDITVHNQPAPIVKNN